MEKNRNLNTNNTYGFTIKELFKTNPLSIVLVYLIIYIFGTLFISFIVSQIFARNNNMTLQEVFKLGLQLDESSEKNIKLYYTVQSYINFFSYMLLFIIVPIFGRGYLVKDAKAFTKFKFFLLILVEGLLFMLISKGLSELSSLIITNMGYKDLTSQNENIIANMVKYGGKGLVVVSTILFAPLVEELVYRKALMELTGRISSKWQKKWVTALFDIGISALIFALPHMLSSNGYPVSVWVVLFLVYFLSGVMLASIYYFMKKNIYSSLLAHTLNNLFAVVNL
jgi:membrane protease YdiL (CAAX protease family)